MGVKLGSKIDYRMGKHCGYSTIVIPPSSSLTSGVCKTNKTNYKLRIQLSCYVNGWFNVFTCFLCPIVTRRDVVALHHSTDCCNVPISHPLSREVLTSSHEITISSRRTSSPSSRIYSIARFTQSSHDITTTSRNFEVLSKTGNVASSSGLAGFLAGGNKAWFAWR